MEKVNATSRVPCGLVPVYLPVVIVIATGQVIGRPAKARVEESSCSSAEAELVALGKLAMEILGVRSMSEEWKLSSARQAI